MTTTAPTPPTTKKSPGKHSVKVTKSQVAAARAQVHISRQLGVPVSKVIEKIAAAGPIDRS